jgi:hypothetical protein
MSTQLVENDATIEMRLGVRGIFLQGRIEVEKSLLEPAQHRLAQPGLVAHISEMRKVLQHADECLERGLEVIPFPGSYALRDDLTREPHVRVHAGRVGLGGGGGEGAADDLPDEEQARCRHSPAPRRRIWLVDLLSKVARHAAQAIVYEHRRRPIQQSFGLADVHLEGSAQPPSDTCLAYAKGTHFEQTLGHRHESRLETHGGRCPTEQIRRGQVLSVAGKENVTARLRVAHASHDEVCQIVQAEKTTLVVDRA